MNLLLYIVKKIKDNEQIKKDYRTTQKYKFKPVKGDAWL